MSNLWNFYTFNTNASYKSTNNVIFCNFNKGYSIKTYEVPADSSLKKFYGWLLVVGNKICSVISENFFENLGINIDS